MIKIFNLLFCQWLHDHKNKIIAFLFFLAVLKQIKEFMHILEQNAVCLMIAKSMFDNTTGR
jgi:hypothetical protein